MDESPRLLSHNSVYRQGESDYELGFDEIREKFLPRMGPRDLVATDMDGSMFVNDLGILVFLEQLSEPDDWPFDPDEFASLLVPEKYETVLNLAVAGELPNIDPNIATMFFRLKEDCIDLYREIYIASDQDFTLSDPFVNEFARKMIALDGLVMSIDKTFQIATNGQLLSRTRFFLHKNRKKIKRLTKAAMMGHKNGERYVNLSVHPANLGAVEQRLSAADLEPLVYDRKVQEVAKVRGIISDLFADGKGSPVRILTTNLQAIGIGALEQSSYAPLLNQECEGRNPVIASKLQENQHGKLGSQIRRNPMFGDVKREALVTLEKKRNWNTKVAIGDSANNDTAMMRLALQNGGIAIIVGKEFERTRERFKLWVDKTRRELADEDLGKRVFYAIDENCH